jgi:Domain of unknown function (DUF4266)
MGRKLGLVALLAFNCVACAQVRPWERDVLSRPDMAWTPDPLGAELANHIHFSKEGSLIGGAAGGGGCGCN